MNGAVLVAAALAVLASCGGRSAAKAEAKPVYGQTLRYDAGAAVNAGQPIALTFWTQVDQSAIYQRAIDDYVALHPNVRIELTSSEFTDHFNKLRIALASEIGPDLFHMHNSFEQAMQPYLAPYPETVFPRDQLEADFRQSTVHQVDGKIPFIDVGLMTSSIYYNVAMWREAGLTERDIPRTWEELALVAKKLTVYGPDGSITRAGFNPNGIGMAIFTAMNLQQGQALFADAEHKEAVLDTAASRRSLEFLRSLYYGLRVVDDRLPESHESFGAGSAAMIYAWGWANNWLRLHHPEVEYDMFRLPAWTASSPAVFDRNNGECSPGVNAQAPADRKAAAFDFIKFFLAKDDYLVELCRQFGVAPTKRSLDNDPRLSGDRLLIAYRNILDKTAWPGILPDTYESTINAYLIDPVIIDRADIGRALADTERRLRLGLR
jgi:multiple sugar transport system substrate-binding protein